MRPKTQLFMLESLDGKISTGTTNEFDVDLDLPNIPATAAGLHRYYEIEQTTDLWSLGSGLTMAKASGPNVNSKTYEGDRFMNFVIIDNRHLTEQGIRYFCSRSVKFVLVTTNKSHPAFQMDLPNLHIIHQTTLNLPEVLGQLWEMGCRNLTVQGGGTINALMLKDRLIDRINLVIAPIIVGGKDVPSLVGGTGLTDHAEVGRLTGLKLRSVKDLGDGYIHVLYDVV